ncbi:hypothetical protein [Nodosilinea nodulosa]|uniref:hypothetical protein n=1 Tax=Nodosilinea nodulosa TaxID=416001 RepID=UPI0003162127|nr:hypothetical protein [Nodosilinea nodulosa]
MKPYFVLFNFGAGVESSALLCKWIFDPSSRPIDPNTGRPIELHQIIVLFAITGLEYQSTKFLVETFILPLLRQHGIRLIQVGRAGPSQKDGIIVASDSTCPAEFICTREDADRLGIWKLSDEHDISASTPKLGRPHTCAMKYKGFTLDSAIFILEFYARGERLHQPIVAADLAQARKAAKGKSKAPVLWGPVLGYNLDEAGRMSRSSEYGCRGEQYLYPLITVLKWDRADCFNYLKSLFGVDWKKSACTRCPFVEEWSAVERYQLEPYGAVDAVQAEFNTLVLNDRMHLFSHHSAFTFTKKYLPEVDHLVADSLAQIDTWALFRVRRAYQEFFRPTDKNPTHWQVDSMRELVKLAQGDRISMDLLLLQVADERRLTLEKVETVDLRKRKFRSNRKLITGLSSSIIITKGRKGIDLRGEPYQGYSQPLAKLDYFKCFPFVRAVRYPRPILSFPSAEEFYVVAPDRINEKVADQAKFNQAWYAITGEAEAGQQLQLFI